MAQGKFGIYFLVIVFIKGLTIAGLSFADI